MKYTNGDLIRLLFESGQKVFIACLLVTIFSFTGEIWAESTLSVAPKATTSKSNSNNNAEALLEFAEKGDIQSQLSLATAYFNGKTITQDLQKAFYWYGKAADQGSPVAQFFMAYFYKTGKAVPQDYEAAFKWYMKSAEQGYVDSQYFTGYYYEKGRGIRQDFKRSFYWYSRAAKQGDGISQYRLANAYFHGWGVAQNIQQSYFWARLAENNHVGGANELAEKVKNTLSLTDIRMLDNDVQAWSPILEISAKN